MSDPYAAPGPREEEQAPRAQWPSPSPGHGPPPPYGAYGAPTGQQLPPFQPTNSSAVVALVLGLVGVLMAGLLTGIPAIVVGNKARREIRAGGGGGDGMALAGVVLGWIATVLSVLVLAAIVVAIVILATTAGTTPS